MGGLKAPADEDLVKNYFSQFGAIDSVELLRIRHTQQLKGFGFVEFREPEAAWKCLENQFHYISV